MFEWVKIYFGGSVESHVGLEDTLTSIQVGHFSERERERERDVDTIKLLACYD
jgi:hypothetical protein